MVEFVGGGAFSNLTADECDRLMVENNSKILELEADGAVAGNAPQSPVVIELLKRENALLSALRGLLVQKLDDNARTEVTETGDPDSASNAPPSRA
jgi:hypothetical protein